MLKTKLVQLHPPQYNPRIQGPQLIVTLPLSPPGAPSPSPSISPHKLPVETSPCVATPTSEFVTACLLFHYLSIGFNVSSFCGNLKCSVSFIFPGRQVCLNIIFRYDMGSSRIMPELDTNI